MKPLSVTPWRLLYKRVTANAALWALVQVLAGYAAHRLPASALERGDWFFAPKRVERGGRFYEQTLRIRRWKGKLPEAGGVFAGGFDKRELRARDEAYLRTYLRETKRAELAHWLAVVPTPLFVRYNPRLIAVWMPVYALATNGPCIAAQRYNRIRLMRVLDRRVGRGEPSPPASAAP